MLKDVEFSILRNNEQWLATKQSIKTYTFRVSRRQGLNIMDFTPYFDEVPFLHACHDLKVGMQAPRGKN